LVNNSLRLRASNSAYLSRTPTVNGNRQVCTFSFWFKRGALGSGDIYSSNNGAGGGDAIAFNSTNTLAVFLNGGGSGYVQTSQVFRDPSAWYHIVIAFNTTQATGSDRLKIYVNGTQVTAFATSTWPTLNKSFDYFNCATQAQLISNGYTFVDGYVTEFNFIDGQQLTANSFGTFNSYGVWQPITYGGSYGTNGFYLPFTGSSSYYGTFNGSSQYLQTGNATNLSLGTGDFTIEGWFNRASGTNNGIFQLSSTSGGFLASQTNTLALAGGSGILTYYAANSSVNTGSLTITNGAWNHFALVRSGTTTTLYYNGVSVSTVSDSTNYTGTYLVVGGYYSTSYTWNGQISNFRVVKGTALYTGNFTPTTSPLTAVTGTQFLTLQSATIVDNSANAYAITNTGTVATTQAYPFTMLAGQSKDYSPAGNNWTNNNIGVLSGSTLDVMTDVPTLTSATAANYATLNPLSTTSTLANGNLTYSSGATFCQSTQFAPSGSGKFYIELVASGSFAAQGIAWGIIGATANMATTAQPGVTAPIGAYSVYSGGGLLSPWVNTAAGTNASNPFTVGQTWQIAIDVTNGYMWLGQNNTWYSSAFAATGNPSTGANPTFTINNLSTSGGFGVLVGNNTAGGTFNLNFGQQPFVYTAPTGFVALNTYNL
jgi:hypothetical protein